MCPDCERHRLDACDSAHLRRAFNETVELFNAVKSRIPFPDVYIGVWGGFYNAIRDHEGGRGVVAEIQTLKDEIARLQQVIAGYQVGTP